MRRARAGFLAGSVVIAASAGGAHAAPGALRAANTRAANTGGAPTPTAGSRAARRASDPYRRLPWILRYAPQRNLGELGLFGGIFVPSEQHDLYDPITRPPEPYWRVGADVGVRAGFYPLRALGVEAEFSAMPTRLRNVTNDFAFLYGFQTHAVVQLPFFRVVPFFLAGGGLLGVRSHLLVQGNDVDPAVHYGGGLKFNLARFFGLRVDVRNILSAAQGVQNSGASHVQVLGGISFILGHKPPPAPPKPRPPADPDRDRDGIANEEDACPDEVGLRPHGCPDTDGDGIRDGEDACPEVVGVAPDGCPAIDTDQDGIVDTHDACVNEPETVNGFEDQDGCPDELPVVVREFTGTIDGIEFEFRKADIAPSSGSVLDRAVAVLQEYPELRVKIVGHTDDVGSDMFNLELSRRRAEAVKAYLVAGGIAADRITTEGKGASEPQVPNDSDEHRAQNRRIEFEIVAAGGAGSRGFTPGRTGESSTSDASVPVGEDPTTDGAEGESERGVSGQDSGSPDDEATSTHG